MVERDRAQAIALALADAKADDVVLIAGKGHETYQEGPEGKRPFDDLAVAREAMETKQERSPRMMRLSAVALWTRGRLQGADIEVNGFSIDTRTLQPGDLFVALPGERVDAA